MSEFNKILNKKAVALRYDESRNTSPVIVASGMGYMAEKIVELATESGVPIYEDNSLATVLTQLDLGEEIPDELYQAIVDIYVFFLQFVPEGEQKKASPKEIEAEMEAEIKEKIE